MRFRHQLILRLLCLSLPSIAAVAAEPEAKPLSVIYVCSASESSRAYFGSISDEIFKQVAALDESQKFSVVFFREGKVHALEEKGLLQATPPNKARVRNFVLETTPRGNNNPIQALAFAFKLRPKAIYLITSGTIPNIDVVRDYVRQQRAVTGTVVHTVLFNSPEFVKDQRNFQFIYFMHSIIVPGGRWHMGTGPAKEVPVNAR